MRKFNKSDRTKISQKKILEEKDISNEIFIKESEYFFNKVKEVSDHIKLLDILTKTEAVRYGKFITNSNKFLQQNNIKNSL